MICQVNNMNNKLFETYKEIKEQIALLEEKKAELELQLFDEFDSNGVNFYELDGYQFARMGRKTYEYSPAIAALTVELSKNKKIEELNGTATLKRESQYIRLIMPKKEK